VIGHPGSISKNFRFNELETIGSCHWVGIFASISEVGFDKVHVPYFSLLQQQKIRGVKAVQQFHSIARK